MNAYYYGVECQRCGRPVGEPCRDLKTLRLRDNFSAHPERISAAGEQRRKPVPSARNAEILRLRADGLTLGEIGAEFDISRSRVQQIVARWAA